MLSGIDVHTADHAGDGSRSIAGRARRALANMIAALTVNAAIILAVPRSTDRNPAPIVLQLNRPLINGCWEEGEFVGGDSPMVAIMDPDDSLIATGSSVWISPN